MKMDSELVAILHELAADLVRNEYKKHRKSVAGWNIRCPICGDSDKDKNKKRGWILFKNNYDEPLYFCHNETCGSSFVNFIKKQHPEYYRTFIDRKRDLFGGYVLTKKNSIQDIKKTKIYTLNIKDKKDTYYNNVKQLLKDNPEVYTFTKKMSDDAIVWLENRKIKPEIYQNWLYCNEGKYKNRIIIPFFMNYNNKQVLYYFQSRDITGKAINKYLNPISFIKPITNIDAITINSSDFLYVTEGYIDSLFIKNCISIGGAKSNDLFNIVNDVSLLRFIQDNDKRGKKEAYSMLQKNIYVFMWTKFFEDNKWNTAKDVNEFLLNNNLDKVPSNFYSYFTNNIFDKIKI